MKKTILAEVDGWTPIIDSMSQEYGLIRAAVFGRVWRFCQMNDGVCRASKDTIAEFLGIDRVTVYRHIDALVEDGYLKDLTPDLRHRPHIYADTGKAGIKLSIVAGNGVSVAESNTGVAESNTEVLQKVTPGVAESPISKTIKRQVKREKKRERADKPRRTPKPADERLKHPAVVTYRDICHRTPNELQRQAIIDGIGDDPAKLEQYAQVLRDWMLSGWNPGNVAGQLDALAHGGAGSGNRNGGNGQKPAWMRGLERAVEEAKSNGDA